MQLIATPGNSTMSITNNIFTPNVIVITGNQHEILRITADNEIFYRIDGEMKKVECPEEIVDAFMYSVFNYTNKDVEDVLIEKYIEKILNHEHSNEYITKLEHKFRKLKLEKLNKK